MSYLKEVFYLLGEKRNHLPVIVCLFLILGILDILGIGLIAPYLSFVVSPDIFIENSIYVWFVDLGLPDDRKIVLLILSITLIIVFLVKSLFAVFINRKIWQFGINHGVYLRSFLMSSYQSLKYEEYIYRNSSDYVHRIHEVAAAFSHTTLSSILKVLSDCIVVVLIISYLAFVNPKAFIILFSLLIGISLIYDKLFRKRVQHYGKISNDLSNKMIKSIHEGMDGFKEIKILNCEKYFFDQVLFSAKGYSNANLISKVISILPKYFIEFFIILFMISLVLFYLLNEYNITDLTATLGLFAIAAIRLTPIFNQILSNISQIRFKRDSVRILYEDLRDIKMRNGFTKKTNVTEHSAINSTNIFKSISLNSIFYKYPSSTNDVLKNISVDISVGESIGIIGPSGSGKSTLIDLILGLLSPRTGEILVNGKNIINNEITLKSFVAYLPQEVFLIDDSLKKNIALGVSEESINNSLIEEAIKNAQLTSVVRSLPKGLESVIGERGVRLSGGQRQRIALARAFYHQRDIIVMDESTSALDSETEKEIVDEIKRLKGKITTIVIAHRLSTLKHCDRIYKMDNGTIIDSGSYEQVVNDTN